MDQKNSLDAIVIPTDTGLNFDIYHDTTVRIPSTAVDGTVSRTISIYYRPGGAGPFGITSEVLLDTNISTFSDTQRKGTRSSYSDYHDYHLTRALTGTYIIYGSVTYTRKGSTVPSTLHSITEVHVNVE